MANRAGKCALLTGAQVVERFHEYKLFDLDEAWVKSMADRGELPYVIIKRHRRYREDIIDLMIEEWCEEAA